MDEFTQTSFGDLLRTFRRRLSLRQQQLAAKLGIHRNTIGTWERGDYLPQSQGMVLELARQLRLNDQETRRLLEASLTALSPYWSVPLQRNPYFTGREEILEALHTRFRTDRAVALTQSSALYGLGGVGKTQIALEYAYRHALDYRAVFWIGAETSEQIIAGFLRMAQTLQLPEREGQDENRVVAASQRWLSAHGQWLLILDNVEDVALLDRFLPSTRSGTILLTTRIPVLGTLAWGLELLPMEQEEGILFLLRRAKVLFPKTTSEQLHQVAARLPAQYAAAEEVVTVLGGLPLALDQAGAYIEETQCGLSAYLELYRVRRAELLASRGDRAREHPASVTTTLTLAVQTTASRYPAVQDLLRVCALLHAEAIPEELFRQGAEQLGVPFEAVWRDPLEWDRVVGVACSYSLLSRHSEEQTLSLHRLVQAVLLDTMTDQERERWRTRVIAALDVLFPNVMQGADAATWKQCERLLPHVLLRIHPAEGQSLSLASLTYKTAGYLLRRDQYAQAEQLFHHALSIRERVLGPKHPEVAIVLNGLAILCFNQGRYAQARRLLLRALHIQKQALGPLHPEVATLLNILAQLDREQGQYARAARLTRWALTIWEQTLGPEHPSVSIALNNLAGLCLEQGTYIQGESFALDALAIREQALGAQHPQVVYALDTLANLMRAQGKYAEAEQLYHRGFSIWEQTFGSEYPRRAILLDGLAECYRLQARNKEAEQLYQQALAIWEKSVGPGNLNVTISLMGLANLARDRGHDSEAEQLYQRVLSLRGQQLGLHHPHTAETLHELALLRQRQGNPNEALALASRALLICSQTLGDAHPKTHSMRMLSVHLVQEQGDVQVEATAAWGREVLPAQRLQEHHSEGDSPSLCTDNPLQGFLDACCELHPRAWCRSADLWQAYERWVAERQERFPLSRRDFAAQLKAHGGRADRTSTMRIWRGIALVKKDDDAR